MQYEKTVKDTYGDDVVVDTCGNVYLTVNDSARDSVAKASLTPEQARKIARALKRAANVTEGKPAKPPKPSVLFDRDGAPWDLVDSGRYVYSGTLPGLTRNDLAAAYGPLTEERP